MMGTSVQDLRALLAARFPERKRSETGVLPTEVDPVDEAMGGGLPLGRLTEWVAAAPSSGTQVVLLQLMLACRRRNQRLALVDASDSFAPETLPDGHREHLLWLRGTELSTAFAAADLLLHDGNFRLVVLDLRDETEKALRRWPATGWYRLQRAAEESGCALLCCTPVPLVPSAAVRLTFPIPAFRLEDRWRPRPELARALEPVRSRGQTSAEPRLRVG